MKIYQKLFKKKFHISISQIIKEGDSKGPILSHPRSNEHSLSACGALPSLFFSFWDSLSLNEQ
jgi:hypothetical protein